jgi:putative oxidoreductase
MGMVFANQMALQQAATISPKRHFSRKSAHVMNFALLILRVTLGTLMAGHGAQKLFGWFKGPGLKGTSGIMESLKLKPARPWAITAASSEFGGGVLTLLGFLNPLGPLGITGSMSMATFTAHWDKPIWASKGGPELPITNIAIASVLMLAGPGKYSLDAVLGTRLPRWVLIPGLAGVAATVTIALRRSQQEQHKPAFPPAQPNEEALRRRAEEAGVL